MTALPRIQADFQDYLLGRSDAITAQMRGNARMGAADLLHVYQHGYWHRLAEALANDYPGLMHLLGPAIFGRLARAYVAVHPSQHPSLRWLGRHLPRQLATHPMSGQPLAAGMARFDWAVAQAFDARDQQPAKMAELLSLPAAAWDSLRLVFAEAVGDFTADAVIGDVRRAVLHDETAWPEASGIDQRWVVWRQNEDVQYRVFAQDEAAAFDLMRAGGSFGAMCQLLGDQFGNPDAAMRSAQIIKDWFERDLVALIEHDAAVSP